MRKFYDFIFSSTKVILIILIIISTISCQKSSVEKPNIILIVPDALRAKQLPCYGYDKIQTKAINYLAESGVIFNYCFVKSPLTTVSFSNLFSGSWFVSNGLRNNEKTLAQYLKENGYYNVGFVSTRVLWSPEHYEKGKAKNEFNRGFDEYFQDVSLENPPYNRKCSDTTDDVLRWLENHKDKSLTFFMFIHYNEPHAPRTSYDAQIELVDNEIVRLIKKLKRISLFDNSLIIFTSDHGESLAHPVSDHGSPEGHGWFLYTEQIQVPLIIKFPRNRYIKSISQVVRNMDIMPTILDYIGAQYDEEQIEGKSLLPMIKRNKNLGLISYHRADFTRICPEGSESIIFSDKKGIYQYIQGRYTERIREFYNVTVDSNEQNNLYYSPQYKNLIIEAKQILSEFSKKQMTQDKEKAIESPEKLDENELRALKSLGYISAGAPTPYGQKEPYLKMDIRLSNQESLKYYDFIRHYQWSIGFMDRYRALKATTGDNEEYFIIANRNKALFRYSKKEGFRSLDITDIKDIALNSQHTALYILQRDKVKIMESDGQIKNHDSHINQHLPCHGIYVDLKNNLYIFKEGKIIKFPENRKSPHSYNIPVADSNHFAVDEQENIFAYTGKEIIKLDKKGSFIHSFGNKDFLNEVSSIAIDKENRIWVLEKWSPSVIIYDRNGEKMTSFEYCTYKEFERPPVPTRQLFIFDDKISIIDNWESILVYSLS